MTDPTPDTLLTATEQRRDEALAIARKYLSGNGPFVANKVPAPQDLITLAEWLLSPEPVSLTAEFVTPVPPQRVPEQPSHLPGSLVTENRPDWMDDDLIDPDFTFRTSPQHVQQIANRFDLVLYRDGNGDLWGERLVHVGGLPHRVVWTTAPRMYR